MPSLGDFLALVGLTDCFISWRDNSLVDDYGPAFILNNPHITQTLSNAAPPKLKNILIQFAAEDFGDWTLATTYLSPLSNLRNLRNLTSLALYNFYGGISETTRDLAHLLNASQSLKHLSLGRAGEHIHRGEDREYLIIEDAELVFLQRLCMQYKSQRGAQPIRLDSLRLGYGMILNGNPRFADLTDSGEDNRWLGSLVDLPMLRKFHVFNGPAVSRGMVVTGRTDLTIDWSQLDDCVSLKQLAVTYLTRDTRN